MTKDKNLQDITQKNNNAENNANTSNTNPAISEQEKLAKKEEFADILITIFLDYNAGKIDRETSIFIYNSYRKDFSQYLTREEMVAVEKEAELAKEKTELELKAKTLAFTKARKEKAVSTEQGQAVIKAEISQELIAVKESFENIKIS